jgi:nitrogenase-stabilizing/protective protein
MDGLIQKLKALSSANEFLEFFGVEYDKAVVHVNRLHILKRFYQYLHRAQDLDGLNEIDMFRRYREFLVQAYTDFTTSNAATEKVFKVFQDTDGKQHVTVDALRSSLGARRAA